MRRKLPVQLPALNEAPRASGAERGSDSAKVSGVPADALDTEAVPRDPGDADARSPVRLTRPSSKRPAGQKRFRRKGVEAVLEAHPELFDLSEYGCEEDELERVEEALGHPIPDDLRSLLRVADGGTFNGQHAVVHMAGSEQLAAWAQAGVHDELDAVPFAHDAAGTVFVIDSKGEWGAEAGAVYRLRIARRPRGRRAVRDAVRVADSLSAFLGYLTSGRDTF
ncbi:MAG: SMI1/KNR4 family protein [Myxococcales bacterium]|nr:SMI1/KNR4 family protein [Myxococcales bacterium]